MKRDVVINELFDEMNKRGLIVVHKSELLNGKTEELLELRRKQRDAMLKDAIPVLQVVNLKLLPRFTSVNGLKKTKLFKPGERYKNSAGHTMVCREAIRRLRDKYGFSAI